MERNPRNMTKRELQEENEDLWRKLESVRDSLDELFADADDEEGDE